MMLVLSMSLDRHSFPSYRRHLHPDLNPGQFFGVVAFVPVISSPKKNNVGFGAVLCRAYFPSYRNHLHRDSNPGQFLGVVTFVPIVYAPK
jgi:hypothetical protein